jgi:hypothetical protein
MLNRLPAIASAAVLAVSLAAPAFAQNTSWGNASNGYGLYHESNGAATGQDTNENGYGLYHESNGAATGQDTNENGYGLYHESNGAATGWGSAETGNGLYHQSNSSATKKPVQSEH